MKIRVLVVGEVLLKGRPVKLTELGEALKQGAAARTAVSYYRELASGEPPALAIQVLKLITELRLPIRLSSQPDLSDTITTSERGLEEILRKFAKAPPRVKS